MGKRRGVQAYQDAMAKMQGGNIADGAAALQELIANGSLPRSLVADAHTNLGTALSMTKRSTEAAVHLATSLQLRPSRALTWYNLGITRADLGHSSEAEAHYLRALELQPSMGSA